MALQVLLLDGRVHDRTGFSCGVPVLDDYLRRRASQHQGDGIATTHVLVDDGAPQRILGYCSLAAAQLLLSDLQESDCRRLPSYPVPAVRLARLAIAQSEQGNGYGQLLLGHVMHRALELRQTLGVRGVIVDAKDEKAAAFYQAYGFSRTTRDAMTLYLAIG